MAKQLLAESEKVAMASGFPVMKADATGLFFAEDHLLPGLSDARGIALRRVHGRSHGPSRVHCRATARVLEDHVQVDRLGDGYRVWWP